MLRKKSSALGPWALFLLCACCRLRALSSGGSVASPPPSPAMPKYKLADYRYGREEMLALYVKEDKVWQRPGRGSGTHAWAPSAGERP